MAKDDVYGEPIEMKVGVHTVIVYHPILTPDERKRREKEIIKAAERFLYERELAILREKESFGAINVP